MAITVPIGFLSRSRMVLTIGDDGVFLVHFKGSRVVHAIFAPEGDEAATYEVQRRLADPRRPPLAVLIDVLEQSYRHQEVPNVSLMDRPRVVRRRLEIAFPEAMARGALPIAEAQRRGQKTYLFAAIGEGVAARKWLDFVAQLDTPPLTMALLPIEALDLIRVLAPKGSHEDGSWTIYVGRHHTGGFRQVVTRRGHLVFTRLTPASSQANSADEVADLMLSEFKATLGYIARLGFASTDILNLIVLEQPAVTAALKQRNLPAAHVVATTPAAAARRLRLPDVLPDEVPYSDFLHAAWFARRTRTRMEILPPDVQIQRQIATARRSLKLLAVSAVGLGALYVTGLGYQVWMLHGEAGIMRAAADRARATMLEREQALSLLGVKYDELVAVKEIHGRLAAESLSPWTVLAQAAGQFGGDELLREYVWNIGTPVRSDPYAAPALRQPVVSARLKVEFAGIRQAPESAVAAAESLGIRLAAALPDFAVATERLPVKVLPTETLSHSDVPMDNLPYSYTADYSVSGGGAP